MKNLIMGLLMTAFTILVFMAVLPLALLHPNKTWYDVDLWFIKQGSLQGHLFAITALTLLYTFMYWCMNRLKINNL